MGNLAMSATLGLDAFETEPLGLRTNYTEDDLQVVIRGVYKQVLGNEHVMESQRLTSAESLLRNGDITVKEFVRLVAQSSLYRDLFFHSSSQYRFIELNFKHLLGRAPQDQSEISAHVKIYNEGGYKAEINSYLDSDEYTRNFGADVVPYPRSIRSQVGIKNEGFNRMFSLLRGSATSDRSNSSNLISSIAANLATPIRPLTKGNSGSYDNISKRFVIEYTFYTGDVRLNCSSKRQRTTSYAQMNGIVRSIHRTGGKIVKIEALSA